MWNVRERGSTESPHSERAGRRAGTTPLPAAPSGVLRFSASAIVLGSLLHALPAQAIELGQGEVQGSLDTTLSHGATWRVEKREEDRAGDFRSANVNDGNYNYDRGIVSNTSKFTTDLDLGYRNFGAFVRATGFLDFENEDGERDRTTLHPEAKDAVGKDLQVLDAYVSGAFEVGDAAVDLRAGRHVLNWGESTFIQNGVNAFNRFDVSRLRLPGSELREALAPVSMVSLAVAPTYNLSMEGFYQLDWEETVIDPVGSYFSTSDYVGPGAKEAVLSDSQFAPLLAPFGSDLDRFFTFGPLTPAINADLTSYQVLHPQLGLISVPQPPMLELDSDFMSVPKGADRNPEDTGQWGVAFRYLAEDLNDTEFGLYFANYHSRLPVLGARTGSLEGVQAGLNAALAIQTGTATTAAAAAAVTPAVTAQVMALVQAGAIPPAAAPALIEEQVTQQVRGQVGGIAAALALDRYAQTGHYFVEYPENVQLLGLSFNTVLGASGWALQGDYSLHLDAPLQIAERVLLQAGIAPMLRLINPLYPGYVPPAEIPAYLATYQPEDLQGYIRHDVSQIQATATKVFGPVLGADALAFVTEAALMHVHSMTDQPLEGPARASTLGDDEDADADATSWGYRMAARLDYNNAIGAVNLFPYVQWRHDVNGNSPAPSGSFSKGLTALTLGCAPTISAVGGPTRATPDSAAGATR